MKVGIMQPYFFPYLGYFDLINQTDQWIVFDTAQYIRHGWVNRNRILHPKESWQYIIVPLKKHDREASINQVETIDPAVWAPRILGQLEHYKKRAPFYRETMELVNTCLSTRERNLSRLNTSILGSVCQHLGIPWNCQVFSEMQLHLGSVAGPGDWALRICEALTATEYINPAGGKDLFDSNEFAKLGIKLLIQEDFSYQYECLGYHFEPNLSVIDVLMWNETEKIRDHLNRHASLP